MGLLKKSAVESIIALLKRGPPQQPPQQPDRLANPAKPSLTIEEQVPMFMIVRSIDNFGKKLAIS
jgi:hypothetical protein